MVNIKKALSKLASITKKRTVPEPERLKKMREAAEASKKAAYRKSKLS